MLHGKIIQSHLFYNYLSIQFVQFMSLDTLRNISLIEHISLKTIDVCCSIYGKQTLQFKYLVFEKTIFCLWRALVLLCTE